MNISDLIKNGIPKTLLILAAIFLAASGLCGFQWAMMDKFRNGSGVILIPLGVAELIVMALSAGGIAVLLILWPASVLYARFGKPPEEEVQRLFDDTGETKGDDPR